MPPAWAEMRHSARATAALQALAESDPALAALALWCRHRDGGEGSPPAETEGEEIRYGEGFARLPLHEQIGLAGHHILHVGLRHSARMAEMAARLGEGFEPDLWQIACDAIVNETILLSGHALPRPALGLTELLAAMGAQGDGRAETALAEWDAERLYHRLRQSEGGGAEGGRGNSLRALARTRGIRPDLKSSAASGPARAMSPAGGAEAAEWQAHMARALAAGRAAGKGLGAIGLRLGDLPRPRMPWELVLRKLLLRATLPRPQPSPQRPARFWLAESARCREAGLTQPPWQPRLHATGRQPRLVLAVDCSGSIGPDALHLLMAETTGIARRIRAALTLLVFDEAIRIEAEIDPAQWREGLGRLELPEGGGTDFRPVLARAARLAPSALVMFTDMDGPCGDQRPAFPVIWASPAAEPPDPPFGRVLSLAR